jgi:hypothetical protein
MTKRQKIIQGTVGIIALLGCFVGPMSWFDNYNTTSTYSDFSENGIARKVTIQELHSKRIYRVVNQTVDITFTDSKTNTLKVINDIDVNGYYYNKLSQGIKVDAFIKGDEVILKDDYNWENLPPFKKPYWGMIYTIFSYVYIGRKIQKNRKTNKTA